ncbi:MAG: hypothetical protein WBD02_05975 [Acidimicrobiia bacterium]
MLKVPAEVLERAAHRQGVTIADDVSIPFDDASYGAPLPHVAPEPVHLKGSLLPERVPTSAPWWLRLLVWCVMLPVSGYAALRISSLFGLFGLKQRRSGIVNMLTTALDKGVSGMGSLLQFAAFWAFVTAVLVTLVLGGYVRWRGNRLATRNSAMDAEHAEHREHGEPKLATAVARSRRPLGNAAVADPPSPAPVPVPRSGHDPTDDWELPARRS